MDNQPPVEPEPKKFMSRKIIWLAFFGAVFAYNIVATIIARSQTNFKGFAPLENSTLSIIFYILLAFSTIIFFSLFKLKSKIENESSPEKKYNYSLVAYANSESMAVYGLMLFLISGVFKYLFLSSLLSIAAFLLVYPKD